MKPRSLILGGFGLLVTTVLAMGVGGLASATEPSAAPAPTGFTAEADIDSAWSALTTDYPEALPTGISFPTTAPAFFHPDVEEKVIFEDGMVEEIAARYWRCAWLDEKLSAPASSARSAASLTAAKELAPATWEAIPDITTDVPSYTKAIASYADSRGISSDEAEFQLDCGVYTEAVKK